MPSVSQAQHRAMEAAAHGHSILGIPKKVGKEFSAADKGKVKSLPKKKTEKKKDGRTLGQKLYGGADNGT
jgi:hypothetical protein